MLDFILYAIISLSFAGIIFMIVRKFPEISSINIETLKTEKSEKEHFEKIKTEMIVKRITEARNNFIKILQKYLRPIEKIVSSAARSLSKKFKETERKYRAVVRNIPKEEISSKIKELLTEGENFLKNAKYDLAEKYYLEALSLDFKNIDIYDALAWLYIEKRQYKEAREALEFVLKLNPNYSDAYYGLAEIAKKEDKIDEAIEFSKKAVELSSNNPKYLDFLIEMCIMGKRADLAKSALDQLKMVNPENQKIGEFEGRIGEIKKNGKK